MKNTILFILFIMILPICLSSQNHQKNNSSDYEIEELDIGSLLKTLDNSTTTLEKFDATLPIVWAYATLDEAEKVTFHLDKLLKYAEQLKEPNYKAEVYLLAGEVTHFNNPARDSFFIEGLKYATLNRTKVDLYMERFGVTIYKYDLERGKSYLEEMRKYIEDTTSLLMVDYYFHSSNYYYAKKNILKSLEYLKKAKKIGQNHGVSIPRVNQNISNIYSDLHADEKSLATNLEQREEARLAENPYSELASNFEIMNAYLNLKDYEAVKATGHEAINLSNRTDANTGLGYMYYLFGLAFIEEGQLDSAEYYFFKGLEISERKKESKEINDNRIGLCRLYFEKGNIEKARFYGEAVQKTALYTYESNNSILAKIYAQSREYKKAYNLLRENWSILEKEQEERSSYKIISTLLDEKFEQEQTMLFLEKEALESKVREQTLTRWALLGLLLSLGGITFLGYRHYRKENQLLAQDLENKQTIEAQAAELRLKNEELTQIDATKTRFFSNLSHEFKTPLTLILNPVSRLLSNGRLNEEDKFLAKSAEQNSLQLLSLTNQVLELTKFEVDKVDYQPIVFNLAATLRKIHADFESLAKSQKISFDKKIAVNETLHLFLDYTKFTTVLRNLISNAIKFTTENGQISFNVVEKAYEIEIKVIDTGRGIHASDLPNIFKRYYQAKVSTQIQEGGTGIGLAICKEYSKLLGGNISVQSQYGKGSTFTLNLPKTTVPEHSRTNIITIEEDNINQLTPLMITSDNSNPTILIVEDNLDMQNYLRLILQNDYQLKIAANGKIALNILEQQHPDIQLIISDVMMPEMNGYELVQHLKNHPKYATIPTVMLTALSGTDDKLKALRIGIDDYLTKPFDDDELKARIDNLLQNQAERRAYLQEIKLGQTIESEQKLEQSEGNSKNLQWLEELETYLNEHLRQSLSIEVIANEMNMSRKTFYTKIKSLTGLTPAKYINEIRYEAARRLIEKHDNWTVKAIALEVGFKDEKNFSRNFKKRFGRNPSAYLV